MIDEVTIGEVVKVVKVVKLEANLEEVKWSSWVEAVGLGHGRMEKHFGVESVESDCRCHACVVQSR